MTTVGPYRLEALVGRGTAGSVWRAVRIGAVPQVVAVKRTPAAAGPESRDRLRREAGVLADLDHPHIVRVLDVLDDGDDVAIVMPFARGGSLHDLLAERGRLTAGETVAALAPVAEALGSAHRHGLLHGDVKPANVLFTSDGEPLLGDFGVAQNLRPAAPWAADGFGLRTVEGTAGYIDPELVATGRPEPRNDVYGLAVVAYLCLTSRLPHAGSTPRAVLLAAEGDDRPSLSDDPSVPRRLAGVVEAALARDPSRRPSSAEALAQALRGALPPSALALPVPARVMPLALDPALDRSLDLDGRRPVTAGLHATAIGASGSGRLDGEAEDGAAGPRRGPDRRVGERRRGTDRRGHDAGDGPRGGRREGPDGLDGGTRAFGPRPPALDPGIRRSRPLRAVGVAVVAVAAVGSGLAAIGLGAWSPAGDGSGPSAPVGAVPATAEDCPDGEPPAVTPGAEALSVEVSGAGCPRAAAWDGRVLSLSLDPTEPGPRRYELDPRRGGMGQLVVGDWDCDGDETPGYYQPTTGTVSYFDAVPEVVGEELGARTRDSGVLGGRAEVGSGDDGCDVVVVVPR